MKKLSMLELGRMEDEAYSAAGKIPLVLVLDNIRSGLNTGAFFRTADCFRIQEILICGITAKPPHKEIHKSGLGAEKTVPWRYFEQTEQALQDMKAKGFQIAAVEQTDTAVDLHTFQPQTDKLALVFGNEVTGVSDEALALCDSSIVIPQFGTKHSLNVSVCAGMVIWEMVSKHYINQLYER